VTTLSILLRFHHGPSKAPSQTQEKNGLARRLTQERINRDGTLEYADPGACLLDEQRQRLHERQLPIKKLSNSLVHVKVTTIALALKMR
jgi:hypothetical protein